MTPAPLIFDDWSKYWQPGSKCPNCLESCWRGEFEPDRPLLAHMVIDFTDAGGVEHVHWTCVEAPEADRESAGYLVRFEVVP